MNVTKVRTIWDATELVVEELIQAAEALTTATGEEKKAFVKTKSLEALKAIESRANVIPDAVEGITFKAVEVALDFIIDRVFAKLDAAGKVNAPAVAA